MYDRESLPRYLTPADLKLRDGDEIILQKRSTDRGPATFAPLLKHYIERFNPDPIDQERGGIPVLRLQAYRVQVRPNNYGANYVGPPLGVPLRAPVSHSTQHGPEVPRLH